MTTTAQKTWTRVGCSNGYPIYRDENGSFQAFTGTKYTAFTSLRAAQDALSGF
jgi:hypothetical protein